MEVSSYGHKYQRSCFLSSKTLLMGYIYYPTSPQKYFAIYKRPQSTVCVFCQFYTFLVSNPHRKQLSAMRNLTLFKEPAL